MKRKRKRRLIGVAIAVAVAAAGTAIVLSRPNRTEVGTAFVETAEELRSLVSASGEIRAKEFVDLQAEVPGIIIDLAVEEGQRVQKGEILLKIDPPDFEADVRAASAAYEAAVADAKRLEVAIETARIEAARSQLLLAGSKTELFQAEANRDRARASFARKKKLHAEDLLPTEDYEVAETTLRVAESVVETARARVEQTEAQASAARKAVEEAVSTHHAAERRIESADAALCRAEEQLRKTIIRSPLTGIITKLNVEEGERAVPGILSNPQATLMTIADTSVIEAEIEVSEVDIITVSIGDPAEVRVDALGDQKLHGQVTEIGQSPIAFGDLGRDRSSQEAKDFKVTITLSDPPASLRPGLSASADITTGVRENATVVPIQALTLREVLVDEKGEYVAPASSAKGRQWAFANQTGKKKREERKGVFVRSEGDAARFRPVVTGAIGETQVEILDGLTMGEEVIVGPYKVLRTIEDGEPIRVNNELLKGVEPPRKRRS